MLDVALVSRALAGTTSPHDVAPVVIDEVLRLVQGADHRAAAERAGKELQAGGTDVRIIAAFLLGVFEERGPAALPSLVDTLADALSRRWEALRPEARRDRVADSALSLLFRSLKASLDYHEKVRDAVWRGWAARVTAALPDESATAITALEQAIEGRITASKCAVELAGLRSRAQLTLQKMPPPPPAPAPPEPEAAPAAEAAAPPGEPEAGGAPSDKVEEVDPHGATSPQGAVAAEIGGAAAAPPGQGGRYIEVSPALEQFMRKLEVFAALVERGEMGKAAIVAQDIRGAVERFDPRLYLPRLLTPHYRLLTAHIQDIAEQWERAGSPAWQAMEQLYQVDLDAFLEP